MAAAPVLPAFAPNRAPGPFASHPLAPPVALPGPAVVQRAAAPRKKSGKLSSDEAIVTMAARYSRDTVRGMERRGFSVSEIAGFLRRAGFQGHGSGKSGDGMQQITRSALENAAKLASEAEPAGRGGPAAAAPAPRPRANRARGVDMDRLLEALTMASFRVHPKSGNPEQAPAIRAQFERDYLRHLDEGTASAIRRDYPRIFGEPEVPAAAAAAPEKMPETPPHEKAPEPPPE